MESNKIDDVTKLIEQAFREEGFPCAHRYGDDSGVVKIIEGENYDIEVGLGKRNQKSNVNGGVGVCLFVKKNAYGLDYYKYCESNILTNDFVSAKCEIKPGDKSNEGVIVKCWLKEVDWRYNALGVYLGALSNLFGVFHRAMSNLITSESVRDQFLLWAMDMRLRDMRRERCAWTKVKESLNRKLEGRLGADVGALAFVNNINYLDLEHYIDTAAIVDDAVTNWGNDNFAVAEVEAEGITVPATRQQIIENAYIALFNEYLKHRSEYKCDDKQTIRGKIAELHATNYLVKTLARSQHGKKYENYVVMGIWGRICAAYEQNVIKCLPRVATQQLVRRGGSHKRGLIDLYFPEIKLAVECDEVQHQGNIVDDALREEDIISAGLIESRNDLYRVDATRSYVDMDEDIRSVVDEIVSRVNKSSNVIGMKSPVDVAHANGKVSIDDGVFYQTKAEALEALGIRKWKGGPHCSKIEHTFYDGHGNGWRVLFLEVDKNNREIGWKREKTAICIAMSKRQMGIDDCTSDDKILVFIAGQNNLGYVFDGVYHFNGEELVLAADEAPLFLDVFTPNDVAVC